MMVVAIKSINLACTLLERIADIETLENIILGTFHLTKSPVFISKPSKVLIWLGEPGWRSGENARLPPMCPGFESRTWRHMWAEFVGSLLCSERFFSGYSGFPLSSKTNI